jgi:hypothetical protein
VRRGDCGAAAAVWTEAKVTFGELKFPKEPPPPNGRHGLVTLAAALAILLTGLLCLLGDCQGNL